MTDRFVLILFICIGLFQVPPVHAQPDPACGLLVMAHGGTDAWNAAIETAVEPLRAERPTAIAFGMADPTTLAEAIADLESQSVECIAVVRLFASASSFLHQTEYLLGLRSDAPRFFMMHGDHQDDAPAPIPMKAAIKLSQEGLLDAPTMGAILAERALAMSDGSGAESVLILAHGPGDDAQNEAWLHKLDLLADSVRASRHFATVEAHTLREDWPEKRAEAEQRIRTFVESSSQNGGRVLVIPFRLFGFGPYEQVLDGLTYEATGTGLLPSPRVTAWIRSQAQAIMQEMGWAANPQ